MNDALSAITATSPLEPSATLQALQQALLGQVPGDAMQANAAPPAAEVDTPPAAAATPILADSTPDAPSVLVALTARTQAPRRGAAPDHPEPSTTAANPAQEAMNVEPKWVAVPAPAAAAGTDTTATLLATPALLTALQAGHTQPLWSTWPRAQTEARRRPHDEPAGPHDEPADDDGSSQADDEPAPPPRPEPAAGLPLSWQERLTHHLKRQAQATPEAPLLRIAFAQWQRGRTLLLVAPRDTPGADGGWLYALRWPPGDAVVSGTRFEARLRWRSAPAAMRWWGVRTTKQEGLHLGRELRAQAELPEDDTAPQADGASIEIRLGPDPIDDDALHARIVDVRVDAIARLWACLDRQWSVAVIACSHPLGEDEAA